KVLDRLLLQLLGDTGVDRVGEPRLARQSRRVRERHEVGCVLLERGERDLAELLRGLRLEEVRAAVDGVDRLAPAALTGTTLREALVGGLELILDGGGSALGQCGLHATSARYQISCTLGVTHPCSSSASVDGPFAQSPRRRAPRTRGSSRRANVAGATSARIS